MPWGILIQALQALLTLAIQEIGRRQTSTHDVIEPRVMAQFSDHHRAVLCELGELCQQPGGDPPTP